MTALPANQEMARITQNLPNVDASAGIPKDQTISAKRLADFVEDHYQGGLSKRRPHAANWLRVMSIMQNIHYFRIVNGQHMPLRKKQGQIRAVRKIMKPAYRRELGRLNSNQIGVTTTPKIGHGESAFIWAERAKAIMSDWVEEVNLPEFSDRANQLKLFYGTAGYYRYINRFRKRVEMEAVPGPELFPIPFDATTTEQSDGIMRVTLVSKQWLEAQDAAREQELGHTNFPRMAAKATTQKTSLTTDFAGIGSMDNFGGKMDGAVVKTVWMKVSEAYPQGGWMFFVEEELFRAKFQEDGQGPPLFNGKLPIIPVYYTKRPNDWWGDGFCEDMISEQLEANRQLSAIVKNAIRNQAFNVYDSEMFDIKDIQGEPDLWIAARASSFETGKPPFIHVPAANLSKDVGAILGLVEQGAEKAVGHESGIIRGKQEGRTEGGPATRLLDENAKAPLAPVTDRIFRAWKETFPEVLDMLRTVWPDEKLVRAPGDLGREMLIKRDDVPSSDHVIMTPTPIIPGGNATMLQMLFQLRTMPADDGKSTSVSDSELRRSLRMMNMNPPGLELVDKVEQRINVRIGMLINDGQKPAIAPATLETGGPLMFEDHKKATELLKDAVLDPGFKFYSPEVQQALLLELQFHGELTTQGFRQPDKFDDDVEDDDAQRSERDLDFAEQDVSSFEGSVTENGAPVGIAI